MLGWGNSEFIRFMESVTILLLNCAKKKKIKNNRKYYVISRYSKKKS